MSCVCTLSRPDSQASQRRFSVCAAGSLNVVGGVTGKGDINRLNSSKGEWRCAGVFSVLLLSLMYFVHQLARKKNGDLEAKSVRQMSSL